MNERRAVMTIARNEPVMLPIWLRYYSRFFAPEDIYLLDHQSTDETAALTDLTRIPVEHEVHDVAWMRDRVQEFQHELIERYDVVLCTDVDEIVAPDPRLGALSDYLDRFDQRFVTCQGREVIHLFESEPALDLGRGVLEQRRHWFANPAYSKPLLAREPMYWHGGLHVRTDGAVNPDPDLYLLHLHRMDFELCLARHRERCAIEWNRRDLEEGWGYQNRIVEADHLERWFYGDTCVAGVPLEIEPIPDRWRNVV